MGYFPLLCLEPYSNRSPNPSYASPRAQYDGNQGGLLLTSKGEQRQVRPCDNWMPFGCALDAAWNFLFFGRELLFSLSVYRSEIGNCVIPPLSPCLHHGVRSCVWIPGLGFHSGFLREFWL